jgi:uncharacterized protein (DUF362 family)
MSDSGRSEDRPGRGVVSRRHILAGGAAALGAIAYAAVRRPWGRTRRRPGVFVARGQSYAGPLERTIREGLIALGLGPRDLSGKRVLLKPNFVEPSRHLGHLTTNPAVVAAAASVLRSWGARVTVGEGPGHVRDTEQVLAESGLDEVLGQLGLEYADLNYEEVAWVRNRGRYSGLPGFYLGRSVAGADLIVSIPKLKTHHWVGMTSAMKNMYGVLPGVMYGWPKNVLHEAGIPQTVCDLNASLPRTLALVDAIECMEGDGPIMGEPKVMGLIVMGTNMVAADATCSRIMGLEPRMIPYLYLADNAGMGPLGDREIEQRGEDWCPVASPFKIPDAPHLQVFRRGGA